MENNKKNVDHIKMVDTRLISNRKASHILKYCVDNNIVTIGDFLDFYYRHGVKGKRKLEISGIVDLLNYKYFNIINEEYINVLNSKLVKNDLSRGFDKVRLRKDINLLKRLGLTIEEIKSFYYFSVDYKNKKIIELINKFVKPTSHHIYLGAYLDALFMEKMKLICRYYNLKDEIYDTDNNRLMKEINDLLQHKEEILNLKSNIIREISKLNEKIRKLEDETIFIDSMICDKKKLLQKN